MSSEQSNSLDQPFAPGEVRQRQGGGGAMLDYIDWPKAVRRLDQAVGKGNWDFELDSDLAFKGDAAGGDVICKGRLVIRFADGSEARREEFGSNQYGRGLGPGDAAKAAGVDALKKCAALFGVALDLAEKDGPAFGGNNGGGYSGPRPAPSSNGGGMTPSQGDGPISEDALYCEECGEPLTETRFKDGSVWGPAQLAVFGRRKHGRILCMTDYRKANSAKRAAEEALSSVPF